MSGGVPQLNPAVGHAADTSAAPRASTGSTNDAQNPPLRGAAAPAAGSPPHRLADLVVPSADAAAARLDEAARRGRLPGFQRSTPKDRGGSSAGGELFRVAAFGTPFDGELLCTAAAEGAGWRLRFRPRLKPLLPAIFAVVLALGIWPGLPLTEKLIADVLPDGWWTWTAYWYLPLAIVGSPWAMWTAWRRSVDSIAVSAAEMLGKIRKELGLPDPAPARARQPGDAPGAT